MDDNGTAKVLIKGRWISRLVGFTALMGTLKQKSMHGKGRKIYVEDLGIS